MNKQSDNANDEQPKQIEIAEDQKKAVENPKSKIKSNKSREKGEEEATNQIPLENRDGQTDEQTEEEKEYETSPQKDVHFTHRSEAQSVKTITTEIMQEMDPDYQLVRKIEN